MIPARSSSCPKVSARRYLDRILCLVSIFACLIGCGQGISPRGTPPTAKQVISLLRRSGFGARLGVVSKSPNEGIVIDCRGDSLDRLLNIISTLDQPVHLEIHEGSINGHVRLPENVLTCNLRRLRIEAHASMIFGKNLQILEVQNCSLGEGVVFDVAEAAGLFLVDVENGGQQPFTVRWHPNAPLWWAFLECPSNETVAAMPASKRLSWFCIRSYHGGADHIHRVITVTDNLSHLVLADCDVYEQTVRQLVDKRHLSLVSFSQISVPREVYQVLQQTRADMIVFDNVDVSKELILQLRKLGRRVLVCPCIDGTR